MLLVLPHLVTGSLSTYDLTENTGFLHGGVCYIFHATINK
jgi:hypothetical protein